MNTLLHQVRSFSGVIRRVRGPLLAAVLAALLFAFSQQIRELYLALTGGWWPLPLAAVLGFSSVLIACGMLSSAENGNGQRLIATLVGLVPLLGVVIGLFNASSYVDDVRSLFWPASEDASFLVQEQSSFRIAAILIGGSALGALIVGLTKPRIVFAGATLYVTAAALWLVWNALAPIDLESLTTICVLLTCIAIILWAMQLLADFTRLPIFGLLVGGSVLFLVSGFGTTTVHVPEAGQPAQRQLLPIDEAFAQWFQTRRDAAQFNTAGLRYPVFIVSAQGGGIYASAHAASFLARMQDICPIFAQHTFAISAVSGGGVGAAFFVSATKDRQQTDVGDCRAVRPYLSAGRYQTVTRYTGDHLSPIVAQLLPDFIASFIPSLLQRFDRSLALERSLSEGLRKRMGGETLLTSPYLSHWTPDGATPAFLANMTIAETGQRLMFAPFQFFPIGGEKPLTFADFAGNSAWPTLAAVAVHSARAPVILPSATFLRGSSRITLVDGAYYDGSGVEGAMDVYRALLNVATARNLPVQLHLIVVGDADFMDRAAGLSHDAPKQEGLLSVPLAAMFNTRDLLAERALRASLREIAVDRERLGSSGPVGDVIPIRLPQSALKLPLAWYLSPTTSSLVTLSTGDPNRCDPSRAAPPTKQTSRLVRNMLLNDCTTCLVMSRLTGGKARCAHHASDALVR